jgi:hypothetical protein
MMWPALAGSRAEAEGERVDLHFLALLSVGDEPERGR